MNFLAGIFFCFGALDYFCGNRFGIGESFLEGLKSITDLLLLMTGFMILAPWIGSMLAPSIGPVFQAVGCDPSLIAGMIMSCDSGAAVLADSIALTSDAAQFNGMIVGAFLGITFVFTIPFALSNSNGSRQSAAVKGLLIGILVLPGGCLLTGCIARLPMSIILHNLWPVALVSIFLLILFLCFQSHIVGILKAFSNLIRGISLLGFCAGVLNEIAGFHLLSGLTPFHEVFPVITEIGVFLAGILSFMTLFQCILQRPLSAIAKLLSIQTDTLVSMLLALANPIPVFLSFEKLDTRGCFLVTAFLTPACFAVGDHLAFAMQYSPSIALPLMLGKILTGLFAFLLAFCLSPFFQLSDS